VIRLCSLTPYSADEAKCLQSVISGVSHGECLEDLLRELDRLRVSIGDEVQIGIAGHEDRLSNFFNTLLPSAEQAVRLKRLEALIVEGDSLAALASASGRVEHRISVRPER